MSIFDNAAGLMPGGLGTGLLDSSGVGELVKALQTGYVTDVAARTGGQALIYENLEAQVVNALIAAKKDLKFFNRLYQQKVNSPLHEYTRRDGVGDYMGIFGSEGGVGRASNQTLERVVKEMKFMQTYREVTLQMQLSNSLEGAMASEIEAGTLTLLFGAEYHLYHGNSAIIPTAFDGLEAQILAAGAGNQNIIDNRGANMSSAQAENNINEMSMQIFQQGGSADYILCPPVVSSDIQALVRSRLFIRPTDDTMTNVVTRYPTQYGNDLEIAGVGAGPSKFFFPMNAPTPSSDLVNRPVAPVLTSAVAGANSGPGRGFSGVMIGSYYYQAFAISEAGISLGSAAVAATVSSINNMVTLTVTPGAAWGSGPGAGGTGIILCRSNVNGSNTDIREFIRIPGGAAGTSTPVTYNDQNEDLPGTAKIFFINDQSYNRSLQWDSFLPLMKFDLYPNQSVVSPFMMVMFGALDVKIPKRHGMMKNVGHAGVASWTYA